MILSIPPNPISGGNFSRNYTNQLLCKIERFKLTINALSDYKSDPNFYIDTITLLIKNLFSNTSIDFEDFVYANNSPKAEYQYIYIISQLNIAISEQLKETKFLIDDSNENLIKNLEEYIKSFIHKFKISLPIIDAFKFMINEDVENTNDLLKKVKHYIKDNNLELSININKQLETQQHEAIQESISKISKQSIHIQNAQYNDKKNIVDAVDHNIHEYIKILDAVTNYLIMLEQYYIALADAIYRHNNP